MPKKKRATAKKRPTKVRTPSAAPRENAKASFTVVGIGASAGGFGAISELLRHLAPGTGMAFIVVQHLAPDHASMLADLLADASPIAVVSVEDGMAIERNRVYVLPQNAHLSIEQGRLRLLPRPTDKGKQSTIDLFFRSLADYAGPRAVGVVLSGSASDGALGLREISAHGGFTIVQDPATAKFGSMPRAAVATGIADLILPPADIGRELVRLGTHPFVAEARRRARVESVAPTDDEFDRLFLLLKQISGVDFSKYKVPTIKRRLQRRMALQRMTSVAEYISMIERTPAEIKSLYKDLLIHVTRFFREPECFEALSHVVFPHIFEEAADKRPIRVWVPGCATGEEPYSIAISLLEFAGERATTTPIQVFATDVSEDAIERARAGLYPEAIASDVSAERLRRFFTRVDGQWRVSTLVRDSCIFARQDLTRDPPFSKLDLVVCRNVLIYLGVPLQRKLTGMFHYALKSTGFLMLGSNETAEVHGELFLAADKKHKIYMKRAARAVDLESIQTEEKLFAPEPARASPPQAAAPRGKDVQSEVTRLLLRYTPPAVLVDQDWQILQTRGKTGPYLELGGGEASLNVLKMAREGLLHPLRSALQQARKSLRATRREGIVVEEGTTRHVLDVQVMPVTDGKQSPNFLIVFEPVAVKANDRSAVPPRQQRTARQSDDLARLQNELSSSRDYLQSIIQDLESANEELQSANEEILSSNEELQSTNEELDTAKEELQSTNEELNTVNEELNARNAELSLVNSDLVNLLHAVPAAILIVSAALRIRRFTPLAEQLLNLIPSDVGRPLGDLKPNIDGVDLESLTREVIDSVIPKELDVHDRSGRAYSLRIRPYKDIQNRIDGAVLAVIDLEEWTKAHA